MRTFKTSSFFRCYFKSKFIFKILLSLLSKYYALTNSIVPKYKRFEKCAIL